LLYEDFLELLKKNDITVKEIENVLGYSKNSIYNNWGKNKKIPKHAVSNINLYIELLNLKKENQKLKLKIESSLKTVLSDEALSIAKAKCNNNNLDLEQYISSLVIANI